MTQYNQDFTMVAGDTKTIEFTLVDGDGVAIDPSGGSARWALADRISGEVLVAKTSAAGQITFASNVAAVAVTAADTDGLQGKYLHELEYTDADSNVSTAAQGTATFKRQYNT